LYTKSKGKWGGDAIIKMIQYYHLDVLPKDSIDETGLQNPCHINRSGPRWTSKRTGRVAFDQEGPMDEQTYRQDGIRSRRTDGRANVQTGWHLIKKDRWTSKRTERMAFDPEGPMDEQTYTQGVIETTSKKLHLSIPHRCPDKEYIFYSKQETKSNRVM
jgi:hypothetical protein